MENNLQMEPVKIFCFYMLNLPHLSQLKYIKKITLLDCFNKFMFTAKNTT